MYFYLYLLPFNMGTTEFGVKLVSISPSTTAQVRAFCDLRFDVVLLASFGAGHLRIEINMPLVLPSLTALK